MRRIVPQLEYKLYSKAIREELHIRNISRSARKALFTFRKWSEGGSKGSG